MLERASRLWRWTKDDYTKSVGTEERNRTSTLSPIREPKSRASTNSATSASEVFLAALRQTALENVSEGHDSGVAHQYSEVVEMLEEALENVWRFMVVLSNERSYQDSSRGLNSNSSTAMPADTVADFQPMCARRGSFDSASTAWGI